MAATPGVRFILSRAPRLLVLCLGGYFVKYALKHHFDISISSGFLVLGGIVALPFVVALKLWWKDVVNEREATRMGAVLPKTWEGKWPGNVDNLFLVLSKFRDGYPGQWSMLINVSELPVHPLCER